MRTLRVLYHLMRADFLERVRRYSFLITLGIVAYAAYMFLPPNGAKYVTLRFADYRGIYNSAWVGALVAMMSAVFISLAGFYIIKNAIARDRETGVGEIIASTPVRGTVYLIGKMLSNFAVLTAMIAVLAIGAVGMQVLRGEELSIRLWDLWSPLLLVTLPVAALLAAVAVVFESVSFLRGGAGNVIYYFVWLIALSTTITQGADVFGHNVIIDDMTHTCAAAFPDYDAAERRMSMGFNIAGSGEVMTMETFVWKGLDWTPGQVFARLRWFLVALLITALATVPFDRFDTMRPGVKRRRGWIRRGKRALPREEALEKSALAVPVPELATTFKLPTALVGRMTRHRMPALVAAELRLMLKGRVWTWYMVALGLMVGGIAAPTSVGRLYLLPAAWIWPILIWSGMGIRERRFGTTQVVYSCPHPVKRQLPAIWAAGVLVALITGSGVAVRLIVGEQWEALVALAVGALFVPSMALALGVWTGSSKLFEVLYLLLWYGGPMNQVPFIDYLGATDAGLSMGVYWWFLAVTAVLLVLAAAGRLRFLRQ
ncbi:MAG: hypothetical protein AB1752_10080 [Candidatus Zixiibacteriota bacterium]